MSLNTKAAVALLSAIKTAYLEKGEIRDIADKTVYGTVDLIVTEDIKKNHRDDFAVITFCGVESIVGREHKKTIRNLSNKPLIVEGQVKFPTKDVVILTADTKSRKEKDNLLERLIPTEFSNLVYVNEGKFHIKGYAGSEWCTIPFVFSNNPNSIMWAVTSAVHDTRTASLFPSMKEAVDSMREIGVSLEKQDAERIKTRDSKEEKPKKKAA